MFSSKILPGVRVIIVNPETRGPLGDSHLGEVSGQKGYLNKMFLFVEHVVYEVHTQKSIYLNVISVSSLTFFALSLFRSG